MLYTISSLLNELGISDNSYDCHSDFYYFKVDTSKIEDVQQLPFFDFFDLGLNCDIQTFYNSYILNSSSYMDFFSWFVTFISADTSHNKEIEIYVDKNDVRLLLPDIKSIVGLTEIKDFQKVKYYLFCFLITFLYASTPKVFNLSVYKYNNPDLGHIFNKSFKLILEKIAKFSTIEDMSSNRMSIAAYQKECLRTWNVDETIAKQQYDRVCSNINELHAAMGLSTEANEILDIFKKHFMYGKSFDKVHLEEELGDVLFYLVMLAKEQNISLENIMKSNLAKLRKRYPKGFDPNYALNKNPDAEKEVLRDFI